MGMEYCVLFFKYKAVFTELFMFHYFRTITTIYHILYLCYNACRKIKCIFIICIKKLFSVSSLVFNIISLWMKYTYRKILHIFIFSLDIIISFFFVKWLGGSSYINRNLLEGLNQIVYTWYLAAVWKLYVYDTSTIRVYVYVLFM